MASAAGGSGAGGGDRCPSGEKGTTPVGRRSKKPSAFHKAALRYLEKEYRECVARGEKNLCVVVRIFKFHVEYSFVKFCNGLSTLFN